MPGASQAQRDAAALRSFGGAYIDPQLQSYVASVGAKLARVAGPEGVNWRFTVVDTSFPTGGTTSDGNIVITRGLLALINDEDELAAVLAHEIGHVVMRHHAQRIERQRQELAPVAQAVEQGQIGEARRLLFESVLRIQAYSRENEFESDRYAVQLLAKAGYPPMAVSRMLARLRDYSHFAERGRGRVAEAAENAQLLASHPATEERFTRAEAQARTTPAVASVASTGAYLAAIEGIIVGRDTRFGLVRNNQFLHGVHAVKLNVPEGYVALPDRGLASILNRDGSGFIFSCTPERVEGSMQSWMEQRMGRRGDTRVETFPMQQGFDAAAASVQARYRDGTATIRLIAVRKDESVCRFLMFVPPNVLTDRAMQMNASIGSMARLSDAEQASVQPYRLRMQRAAGGETLEALVRRRGSLPEGTLEFLRMLNGVGEGQAFTAGQPIKMVSQN